MGWARSIVGLAVSTAVSLAQRVRAEEHLKVGAHGVGEISVPALGQTAGIFRKHGLALDVLYADGGGVIVLCAHLPFRGFGRMARAGRGFQFHATK
jgi:hypothetical protein